LGWRKLPAIVTDVEPPSHQLHNPEQRIPEGRGWRGRDSRAIGRQPHILEINPPPGLSPGISDLVIEGEADGINHAELVNMVLNAALERHGMAE
jgi:hypothetical protein